MSLERKRGFFGIVLGQNIKRGTSHARRLYGAPPLSYCPHGPAQAAPLYTTDEVAKLLRVSQRTVQDWIRSGTHTAVRYGRLLRIRQADLASFGEVLNERTPAASPTAGAEVDLG